MSAITKSETIPIGVGFDTARYGHHVTFVGEDRQEAAKDFTFLESRQGYAQLEAALRHISERFQGAVHFDIRIDAAGQYAENIEAFLRRLELPKTVSVGEPKRNRDYKNAHYPKRKADEVDSRACARFAAVERPPASAEVGPAMRGLREVCSALISQRKQTTGRINRLHNVLSRVFPELAVLTKDLSAQWVLELLAKYPSPARIAAAQRRSLVAMAHIDAERAEQLQSAAQTTVASLGGAIAEGLVRHAVEELRHSQRAESRMENLLEATYDALGPGGHRQVKTIPGIGKRTAAALAAKIVDIDRFSTPEQLVNYFGTFPEENTSGVDRRGNKVTKGTMLMSVKGNDLVRGHLWMASQSGIQHNPALRALYARQRAKGKSGGVALGHCMSKLLHLVFAVWKTDQPFDPAHYPWEPGSDQRQGSVPEQPVNNPAQAAPTAQPANAAEHQAGCAQPVQTAPSDGPPPLSEPPAPGAATPCGKTAAGHKKAMPSRKVVTAAGFHLATRSLPEASPPSKSAQRHRNEAAGESPTRWPSPAVPSDPAGVRPPAAPGRSDTGVWVDFAHVRAQITMEQVLSRLGVYDRLRGSGPQKRGPCPIHDGQGGSARPFSVHLGKSVFRCLNPSCAAHGNVLDLWAAVRGMELREAAIDLAQTFHLQLAPTPKRRR